jgi:hypothetical protein
MITVARTQGPVGEIVWGSVHQCFLFSAPPDITVGQVLFSLYGYAWTITNKQTNKQATKQIVGCPARAPAVVGPQVPPL